MNIVIFGSRTLSDNRVVDIIETTIERLCPTMIITSGETTGVCEIARHVSKEKAIPLLLKYADNKKYARGMYEHRAKEILKDGDFVLFIHDGISKGTNNEIQLAKAMNKEYEYHRLSLDDAEEEWKLKLEWE